MKIPHSTTFALPAILAGALLAGWLAPPSTAAAAILPGSTAQFLGTAQITPDGSIAFLTGGLAPVPAGADAAVRIAFTGNLVSYAGYDSPNPAVLPGTPNYFAGFRNVVGGMVPAGTFIYLPAVAIAGVESGPAVSETRFEASSWSWQFDQLDGTSFFLATARGIIYDDSDGTSIEALFSLSSQNINLSTADVESFSATLVAIPVPAAAWMLGSGLLAMLAASRRRRT